MIQWIFGILLLTSSALFAETCQTSQPNWGMPTQIDPSACFQEATKYSKDATHVPNQYGSSNCIIYDASCCNAYDDDTGKFAPEFCGSSQCCGNPICCSAGSWCEQEGYCSSSHKSPSPKAPKTPSTGKQN